MATRRPLPLRVAKLRAAGSLAELGPSDLSFTASECEELLTLRRGRTVTDDEVEAVVAASEGWPMGVALTGVTGPGEAGGGAIPREVLFNYLAEEVLDRLDPRTRLALVDSSVPDTLTPALVGALGLEPDFIEEAERSGVFLRKLPSGARCYHPLLRAFLRERLEELRTEPERAALHECAAASLSASGPPGRGDRPLAGGGTLRSGAVGHLHPRRRAPEDLARHRLGLARGAAAGAARGAGLPLPPGPAAVGRRPPGGRHRAAPGRR